MRLVFVNKCAKAKLVGMISISVVFGKITIFFVNMVLSGYQLIFQSWISWGFLGGETVKTAKGQHFRGTLATDFIRWVKKILSVKDTHCKICNFFLVSLKSMRLLCSNVHNLEIQIRRLTQIIRVALLDYCLYSISTFNTLMPGGNKKVTLT